MAALNNGRMRHVCGHVDSGTGKRCKIEQGLREHYVWGVINMKMMLRCGKHKPQDVISTSGRKD